MSPYQVLLESLLPEPLKAPTAEAGSRVLADRHWPADPLTGSLTIEDWHPTLAPSPELHDLWQRGAISSATFEQRYREELQQDPETLLLLMRLVRRGSLILLTAAEEAEKSHLPTLRLALLAALREEDEQADGYEPSSPVCYDPGSDFPPDLS